MKVEGQCHCGRISFEADIAQLRPSRQIWFRSAQPWVTDLSNVQQVERQ
jgi:hypothetical protein